MSIENEILMHFRSIKKVQNDMSLDETIDVDKDGNSLSLIDILALDDTIADDLDIKLKLEHLKMLVLEELDEREKTILIMRYGLKNNMPITQRETAKKLGISRSYVSRIEKKALEKLRKKMDDDTIALK